MKLIRNLSKRKKKLRNFPTKKLKILQNDNSVITDSIDTFKVIFPDSKIAFKIELGKERLKACVLYYHQMIALQKL